MCERFGESSALEIDKNIIKLTPVNTLKARASAWKQFEEFCSERNYTLNQETTLEQLAMIMKDFAFNMRKTDGTDYKEQVVKTLWNTVAKVLQEKYHNEYKVSFNPFKDVIFASARQSRDAKRKQLQCDSSKMKVSAATFSLEEHNKIIDLWDEDTPDGLQRKFYHIVACELYF